MDSPSAGVQWSQSLETPVKKRMESGGAGNSPKNSIIQRLRGLQPSGPFDESVTAVEGWSALLETPPRKATKDKGLEPDQRISDDILDKLRGNPPLSRLSNIHAPNHASQDDSFHSASSSIVSETDEYQRELHGEPRGYPNNGAIALNEDTDMSTQECYRSDSESTFEFNPKLEDNTLDVPFISQDADVGLTLPSSLVHELERESLSIGSQTFQSQIFPESQSDVFASMPSSELNDDALGESSGASQQQFQRLTGVSTDNNSNLNGSPLASRKPTQVEPNQDVDSSQANVLDTARDFRSQDLNTRDMRIESWAASLPRDGGQDVELGVRQEALLGPDSQHGEEPVELLSDDDFGNIRFSQLDDGFNAIPEATQRPQRGSPVVVKTAANHPHADEGSWLSTSASMLGDMSNNINRPSYADDRKVQPSNMSGGFATAGGKKLAPLSKAALARVANLFEEDDSPSFNRGLQPSIPESDIPANVDAPISFTGFQTAGKKALLPISDTAREKIAFLFEDEDLDINPSRMTARNSGGVSSKPAYSKSVPLGPKNIQHQQIGGFTSGSGKKLAEPSKDIFEKWSKRFAEDDDTDLAMPRATAELGQPGHSIQPPVSRTQPMGFTGFSSGTGRALAPVSKAAQDRALSFLELDEPSMTAPEVRKNLPTQGFSSSSSSSISSNSGSSGSTNGKILPGISGSRISNITGAGLSKSTHQPVVSSHMNNLKLKSIRSTSTGPPSLSGIMKPLYKSRATFKSPLAFKPPLKKAVSNLENEIPANGRDNGGNNDTPISSEINSTKNPVSTKRLPNRRSTLHPNARPTLAEPPNLTFAQPMRVDAVTPSYTPLFDFQSLGKRSKLREVLGPPRQHSVEELLDLGVPHDAIRMTLASAQSYRFDNWGVDEAYQGLTTRGAVPHLLSNVWLKNHYGLIVWKLACYVRSWPEHFISSKATLSSPKMSPLPWFSPTKVLDQLAYRYEREVNRAERSALRRIVEGDDSAAKHMVLCIASITREYSEEINQDVWRVTVTDGWYVLPATLDACLIRVLERGKRLKVGSKLHVCRAKLSGAENGVAILELAGAGALTTSVSIVLQANSTKLAGWDTKLGFQRTPLLWTTYLGSILPEGGLVPGLDVIVLRKYPVTYLETLADGTTKIKRTAREEEKAVEAHREQIQKQYQDIVLQVEREFGIGSQADQGMIQEQIQSRAGELLQAGITTRNVMPFFSIRVGNYVSDDAKYSGNGQNQEALVTFWHSDHTPYQEGHRVRMTSLMAKKAGRETGIEDVMSLTGTRMTTVREMPTDPEALLLTNYRPREIILCSDVGHLYQGAEIDMAVVILAFNETIVNSNKVYFIATDASKQLVLVEHQLSSTSSGADCQLPSFLKVRSRILMANARFKLRDHRLGLDIVSSLQTYTQVSLAPPPIAVPGIGHVPGVGAPTIPRGTSGWPAYAQSSLHLLNDLCNKPGINNAGEKKDEETLLELMAKANTILERMRPSF
ncbi:Breast cancer 2, early onset [Entomortierella chlamydospora]|nr:Breast cancer 2, early onset [Entomortierella chlamydospora]